jgi:predicted transcriptional regulator of viral defense system
MKTDRILEIAMHAGGTITSAELVEAGARWEDIYRLRDSGRLLELSRGVYRVADAPAIAHLDLIAVCRRAPSGMICLNSASGFWDLTDEAPDSVHLAIPRGRHRPHITHPPTTVHLFAADTFDLGRIQRPVESGELITISSPERTVVDMMRLRSRVGRDQALAALRAYLQRSDAHPGDLLALARKLRIGGVLAAAMEPLLS